MNSIRIDTDLAIIGNGDTIKNAAIVVENNKITYVGEAEHSPTIPNTISTPVVTPGFWDAHGHYYGLTQFTYEERFSDPSCDGSQVDPDIGEVHPPRAGSGPQRCGDRGAGYGHCCSRQWRRR